MTPVSRALGFAAVAFLISGSAGAGLGSPAPPVVKTRLALDRVAQAGIGWTNQFDCSGCHKQTIPLVAIATARTQGHDAPLPGVMDLLVSGMMEGTSGQDEDGCFSFGGTAKFTMATTFGGRGLEMIDRQLRGDMTGNLLAAADCLLTQQSVDGRLPADTTELPVSQGDFITTSHAIYTWKRAFERDAVQAYDDAADLAETWLRGRIGAVQASPTVFTTQDKAMLLAGLAAAGADTFDPDVATMRMLLVADQLGDGSWKLKSTTAGGNAHGTGQAVFALCAAGYDSEDPAVAAGRDWLLTNQGADGSWPASNWQGGTPSLVAPSMWGALALASFPSPLNTLRLAGDTIEWSPVEGADDYDVIRGSLSALAEVGGLIDLGEVDCLAPATTATFVEDTSVPDPGEGFFYLMRIRWDVHHDIYGRSSAGLEQVPSTGDCGS